MTIGVLVPLACASQDLPLSSFKRIVLPFCSSNPALRTIFCVSLTMNVVLTAWLPPFSSKMSYEIALRPPVQGGRMRTGRARTFRKTSCTWGTCERRPRCRSKPTSTRIRCRCRFRPARCSCLGRPAGCP
eukprot:9181040-Heterocapsa_arctica.AAC.1